MGIAIPVVWPPLAAHVRIPIADTAPLVAWRRDYL